MSSGCNLTSGFYLLVYGLKSDQHNAMILDKNNRTSDTVNVLTSVYN